MRSRTPSAVTRLGIPAHHNSFQDNVKIIRVFYIAKYVRRSILGQSLINILHHKGEASDEAGVKVGRHMMDSVTLPDNVQLDSPLRVDNIKYITQN